MGKTKKSQAYPKRQPAKVYIGNSQRDFPINKPLFKQIIQDVLLYLQIECEQVSLYFVTKKKIAELHDQFFQDPSVTDCISFPLKSEHLGEVFVCPAVGIAYAKEKGLNPLEETLLYTIHGILHLIGYDDQTAKDKKTMRRMEKKCMEHVKSKLKVCSS